MEGFRYYLYSEIRKWFATTIDHKMLFKMKSSSGQVMLKCT